MDTDSKSGVEAPPIVPRPHLAYWLWARDIDWKAAGELIEVHPETVRCYCLRFGAPDRRVPRPEIMRRILGVTAGEVDEADFHRPRAYRAEDFRRFPAYEIAVEGVSDELPRVATAP